MRSFLNMNQVFQAFTSLYLYENTNITFFIWVMLCPHLADITFFCVTWPNMVICPSSTISEAIGSSSCRYNSSLVPCWLRSWLNHNFLLVLGYWTQLTLQSSEQEINWVSCIKTADSFDIQPSEWKITGVSCIELNQPSQLNINKKLTEMMRYTRGSYFFWECRFSTNRCLLIPLAFSIKSKKEVTNIIGSSSRTCYSPNLYLSYPLLVE